MILNDFIHKLKHTPKQIAFSETMAVIESNYHFIPTAFTNGTIENADNENLGSCKLLAFAKEQRFTKEEALACFGTFYFDEVLNDPEGEGHQNIRNFMQTGFEGLVFNGKSLQKK